MIERDPFRQSADLLTQRQVNDYLTGNLEAEPWVLEYLQPIVQGYLFEEFCQLRRTIIYRETIYRREDEQ